MIYIIYIQRFISVHLKTKFVLIYINLYNIHLLIHLLYVLYSASIHHVGISAIEIQYYYSYYCTILVPFKCCCLWYQRTECVNCCRRQTTQSSTALGLATLVTSAHTPALPTTPLSPETSSASVTVPPRGPGSHSSAKVRCLRIKVWRQLHTPFKTVKRILQSMRGSQY